MTSLPPLRWKRVTAHVRSAVLTEPLPGMHQKENSIHFGANDALSVEGRRYVLEVEYEVEGQHFSITFGMICDPVPTELVLAYNPSNPAEWDWPEDHLME